MTRGRRRQGRRKYNDAFVLILIWQGWEQQLGFWGWKQCIHCPSITRFCHNFEDTLHASRVARSDWSLKLYGTSSRYIKNCVVRILQIEVSNPMAPKVAKSVAASQFLHLDIVADILSRLPVKSLLRFRCVCRQWNSLIYDPLFLSRHLYSAPSNLIFIPRRIDDDDIKLYDFLKDGTLSMHSSYKIRLKDQGVHLMSNIVHGLMCAYDFSYMDNYLSLLNPFTREFAQLPVRNNSSWRHDSFGFGYDVTTGKYKLVRLCFSPNFPEDKNQYCEILTLGSKEWRYLGKAPCQATVVDAVFEDGALYWMGVGRAVLSFDIKQEKFASTLGPPDTLGRHPGLCSYLHGSAGHLYLIYRDFGCLYFKIWLLKDFATGLWIDLYDIDATSIANSSAYFSVFSIEDKKVLLVLSESRCGKVTNAVLSYDTCSKTFLKIYDEEGLYVRFPLCSESLISPRKLIGNVL